jgi:hypothetical protein
MATSGFLTICRNPYCNHGDSSEAFCDTRDNGCRVCPKCFVEQGPPVTIHDDEMRCRRCLAIRPRKDFEEITVCKDGDYVMKCRLCGYVNK